MAKQEVLSEINLDDTENAEKHQQIMKTVIEKIQNHQFALLVGLGVDARRRTAQQIREQVGEDTRRAAEEVGVAPDDPSIQYKPGEVEEADDDDTGFMTHMMALADGQAVCSVGGNRLFNKEDGRTGLTSRGKAALLMLLGAMAIERGIDEILQEISSSTSPGAHKIRLALMMSLDGPMTGRSFLELMQDVGGHGLQCEMPSLFETPSPKETVQ